MNKRSLLWTAWGLLWTIVVFGSLALEMARSTVKIPILLEHDKVLTEFRLHRVVNTPLDLTIHLPSISQGSWAGAQTTDNITEFPKPGRALQLNVSWSGGAVAYEALPSISKEANVRQLIPRLLDDNPQTFGWPFQNTDALNIPPGSTLITVRATHLDPDLVNKKATLVVPPRVTFKRASPGYEFLWWFYFWPAYLLILAGSGVFLYKTQRQHRIQHTPRLAYHPESMYKGKSKK